MKEDDDGETDQKQTKKRPPIAQDTILRKKNFFDELKRVIDSIEGATLRKFFNKVDSDRSGDVNFNEFRDMFTQMQIDFRPEDLLDIF